MKPVLLEFGDFKLYSYPLFLGLAWGHGLRKAIEVPRDFSSGKLLVYLVCLFLSAWVGAKLFFAFFSLKSFSNFFSLDDFWFGGGLVFYGGLLFSLALTLLFNFFFKYPDAQYLSKLAAPLCYAHAIGRLGCFFAGCCFGKFSKLFPDFRHPVQLYEALSLMALGYACQKLVKGKYPPALIISFYLVSYGSMRFLLELFRGDNIRGIYLYGLSTSQIISLAIIISGNLFIFRSMKSNSSTT